MSTGANHDLVQIRLAILKLKLDLKPNESLEVSQLEVPVKVKVLLFTDVGLSTS